MSDVVTADDLLVSDTIVGSVHAYREGEKRALCGHRSTRRNFDDVDVEEAPDAAWRAVDCQNCQRALAPRYRSVCDRWEDVRALEENDVVALYLADGGVVEGTVYRGSEGLEAGGTALQFARITTEPERLSYLRDPDQEWVIRANEGDAPTVAMLDLLDEVDANPEREIESIEVVDEYDPYADETEEEREALMRAAERVAAEHRRMSERTESREEGLWNVNYATALRDVAYRLRSDGWPVDWVRQKVESKVEHLDGYPDDVRADPEADRNDVAKAAGKAAGYEQAARLVAEYAPEDDGEPEIRADGGSTEGPTDTDRWAAMKAVLRNHSRIGRVEANSDERLIRAEVLRAPGEQTTTTRGDVQRMASGLGYSVEEGEHPTDGGEYLRLRDEVSA